MGVCSCIRQGMPEKKRRAEVNAKVYCSLTNNPSEYQKSTALPQSSKLARL